MVARASDCLASHPVGPLGPGSKIDLWASTVAANTRRLTECRLGRGRGDAGDAIADDLSECGLSRSAENRDDLGALFGPRLGEKLRLKVALHSKVLSETTSASLEERG